MEITQEEFEKKVEELAQHNKIFKYFFEEIGKDFNGFISDVQKIIYAELNVTQIKTATLEIVEKINSHWSKKEQTTITYIIEDKEKEKSS